VNCINVLSPLILKVSQIKGILLAHTLIVSYLKHNVNTYFKLFLLGNLTRIVFYVTIINVTYRRSTMTDDFETYKTFKERQKEYAIQMYNKMSEEEKKEYRKAQYLKNKDVVKKYQQTEKYKSYKKAYAKRYREAHREEIKAYREAKKEELTKYHVNYNASYQKTDKFKEYKKEYMRKYRAAKKLIDTDK
jgi:hypothetical protein